MLLSKFALARLYLRLLGRIYLVCVYYLMYRQGYRGTPRLTLIKGELTNSPTAFPNRRTSKRDAVHKSIPPRVTPTSVRPSSLVSRTNKFDADTAKMNHLRR